MELLELLADFLWWLLSFIGIYRDLPPIPDAPAACASCSPKKAETPPSNRDKHVTFSPVRDFIPEYDFNTSGNNSESAPSQLLKEVQRFEHIGSQQVIQLHKILCDLSEELDDALKENSRLVKENNRLKEKELTDSRRSENE